MRDSLSGKFFFAHAPLFSALAGSNFGVPASLPGFGTFINVDNRVLSLQEIHTFSAATVNESRFGYSFLRHDEIPQESVQQFPGDTLGFAHLGTGLTQRDFRTTDYHLFVQDDWKLSPRFTINLGLRYELDPPPYDSQGRIGGFDPALYKPRMEADGNGFPVGPPQQGIIEAGNALPQYSLPGVTRVGKRVIKSIDPNNFGPRVGIAWSPLESGRLAVRAG